MLVISSEELAKKLDEKNFAIEDLSDEGLLPIIFNGYIRNFI